MIFIRKAPYSLKECRLICFENFLRINGIIEKKRILCMYLFLESRMLSIWGISL